MTSRKKASPNVVCVKNDGYQAALELRKIYDTIPDEDAAAHHLLRVIDESGDDYLYPEQFFVSIELPLAVRKALSKAS